MNHQDIKKLSELMEFYKRDVVTYDADEFYAKFMSGDEQYSKFQERMTRWLRRSNLLISFGHNAVVIVRDQNFSPVS